MKTKFVQVRSRRENLNTDLCIHRFETFPRITNSWNESLLTFQRIRIAISRFDWSKKVRNFWKRKNVKQAIVGSSIRRNRPSPNCPARAGSRLPDQACFTSILHRPTDFGDRQPFQFQGTAVKLALAPFITPLLSRVCRWRETAANPWRFIAGFSSLAFNTTCLQHSAWWFVFDESSHRANLATLSSSFASSLCLYSWQPLSKLVVRVSPRR